MTEFGRGLEGKVHNTSSCSREGSDSLALSGWQDSNLNLLVIRTHQINKAYFLQRALLTGNVLLSCGCVCFFVGVNIGRLRVD